MFAGVSRGLVRLKEQMYVIKPVSDADHVMYKHLRHKRNTFTFTQPPAVASLKSSRWVIIKYIAVDKYTNVSSNS